MFGAGALCLSLSACAGQRDHELRLAEELGRARADAAWHAARTAEMEARLTRLEQRLQTASTASTPRDSDVQSRLEYLITLNERLLSAQSVTPAAAEPTTLTAATSSTPEEQLRALVEQLRGRPGRFKGPLTREQNSALRLLLTPERQLDAQNPWDTPWR